ncbi:MAG TPA: muconolactone Delta-isomerase family protein [Opitutaceae bacterium]|nr:muconolactone Delta-isomerase family protein [Opitutaceae bacterium]
MVEIDHPKTGQPLSLEAGRAFIENVILPTLARAEQLAKQGRIIAGGPVAGRIALRFIAEVESPQSLDRLISGLPLWPISDTRVTPLVDFTERRAQVELLLQDR